MSHHPINVFVIPSRNKNNTYIDLFISAIKQNSVLNPVFLEQDNVWNLVSFVFAGKHKNSTNIIHIHWSTVLYGSQFFIKSVFLIFRNFFILFLLKFFFGFKVVWTVHNFFAHDYPYGRIDMLGRSLLLAISDCLIVQEKTSLEQYRKKYSQKNIEYIPHGNYVRAYGPWVESNQSLRKTFGFLDTDIVLISFGAIAPYKRNEKIIEAVLQKRKVSPNLKLLVVGKGKNDYVDHLKTLAGSDSGIVIMNYFIPDSEMPHYLAVADYSVFFYDESEMTSGGIVLSLSYGVPVITRDIPTAELVRDESGFVFTNEIELTQILGKINRDQKEQYSRDIIESIHDQNWSNVSKRLNNIYGKFS